jgi:hypothetical protein
MGGVLLTALLLATAIRRRTTDLWPLAVCVLLACLALLIVPPRQFFPQMVPLSAAHVAHLLIFLISGLWILAVVVADLAGRRDREAVFLACWLIGTLVFTTFVNWTISGRNLLPAAPVLGILLARRLEERAKIDARAMRRPALVLLLLLAYFLSLGVTAGDYQWAKTIKENAGVIHQKYAPLAGAIWFQGHWGFQYYLEALGHSPLNFDGSRILPRDLLVVPLNNTNLEKVDRDHFTLVDRATAVVPSLFAVLSVREGVGFYSTVFGPLPFALGLPTIESYEVWRLSQP